MADDQEIEVKKNVEGIEEGFNETNTSTNLELTVNEIIEQHVGSFGLSQLLQVFLVSLAWVFDAHNTLVTVFTDSQPAWKCKVAASSSCSLSAGMCGLAPGTWDWVGGHKSSTIAEWGLICGHKFRAGVPASMYFIGSLFGMFFFSSIFNHQLSYILKSRASV